MNTEPFDEFLVARGRSVHTRLAYVRDVTAFARWYEEMNETPFAASLLTATDVQAYRRLLLRRKAAPATINRVIAALRVFGQWAVRTGELAFNPLEEVRRVQEQAHAPRWLDAREQLALLREIERVVNTAQSGSARRQARRDAAIVQLLLNAGLRVGEVCALDLGDIVLSSRKGQVTVREGKDTKRRTVPLNVDVRHALEAWLKERPAVDTEVLFVGNDGTPLQSRGVQRMLATCGRRAGIEVTPHQLRHSFAKKLVDSGVSLDQVAALLGHASLNTTRGYTLPSAEDLERAVERVGSAG